MDALKKLIGYVVFTAFFVGCVYMEYAKPSGDHTYPNGGVSQSHWDCAGATCYQVP